ncbi:MAG: hypothetical protein DCF21_08340 [Leptolyngbya sp.]|nr:MAG: hypothetical protein DCF21_08340 [Leptolyngbya sp.]
MQRFSLIGFGGLVLLSAELAVLIHRVSPLREPSFEVNSANAGTLVPWLQWVPETTWLWASFTLALLLAISLTWVLYQRSQTPKQPSRKRTKTALSQLPEPAQSLQGWRRFYTALCWAGFAASLFTILQILFLGYLFVQHIVD